MPFFRLLPYSFPSRSKILSNLFMLFVTLCPTSLWFFSFVSFWCFVLNECSFLISALHEQPYLLSSSLLKPESHSSYLLSCSFSFAPSALMLTFLSHRLTSKNISSMASSMSFASWLPHVLSVFNPNPVWGFTVYCVYKDLLIFLHASC